VFCSGSGVDLHLPFVEVCGVLFFWFKGLKTIYVYRPRWRVTINFKFLAMASSEDTYQLLFVSYLLASGHDLITRRSVNRPATKCSHTFRAADSDPSGGGPHCSRLLMTSWASGKDMGIVTSMWVHIHDTEQLDLKLLTQSQVVSTMMLWGTCPARPAGKQEIVRDVGSIVPDVGST
jgi:hypothetical protein